MSAQDNFNLAENPTFKLRVNSLMKKSALAIIGETNLPPIAISKRHKLAESILSDRKRVIEYNFCHALTSQGTLAEASTDSDIEFTINSIFSDMAGVSAQELEDFIASTSRVLTFDEAVEWSGPKEPVSLAGCQCLRSPVVPCPLFLFISWITKLCLMISYTWRRLVRLTNKRGRSLDFVAAPYDRDWETTL